MPVHIEGKWNEEGELERVFLSPLPPSRNKIKAFLQNTFLRIKKSHTINVRFQKFGNPIGGYIYVENRTPRLYQVTREDERRGIIEKLEEFFGGEIDGNKTSRGGIVLFPHEREQTDFDERQKTPQTTSFLGKMRNSISLLASPC